MFDRIKDIVSDITGGKDLGSLDLGGFEKYLDGVNWPVEKNDLVNALQNNGAPSQIVDKVRGLDVGTIDSPDDLVNLVRGELSGAGDDLRGQTDAATQDIKGDVDKAAGDAKANAGSAASDAKGKLGL